MQGKKPVANVFFNPCAELGISERNLPHWCQQGVMYFVTFRLADSLPAPRLEQLQAERQSWREQHSEPYSDDEMTEYSWLFSERVESWLDAGSGSCALAVPENAKITADALLYFDEARYWLDEWVIMPNHVHVLVTPGEGHSLASILHSWKSFTGTEINKRSHQIGRQFWQHESYDHIVRSENQLAHFRRYIRENPEKANVGVTQASWLH